MNARSAPRRLKADPGAEFLNLVAAKRAGPHAVADAAIPAVAARQESR